jgi:acylphosphatase
MSTEDRARLTALARGRVQGVGYRYFVVAVARGQGLDGYARNLPDGHTVEVVAEGRRAALDGLIADLRRGPLAARVDAVDVSWDAATGGLGPFDVRH